MRVSIVSEDGGFACLVGYWAARGVRVDVVAPRAAKPAPPATATKSSLSKSDRPADVERILSTTHGKVAVSRELNRLYRDTAHAGRVYRVIKPRIKG